MTTSISAYEISSPSLLKSLSGPGMAWHFDHEPILAKQSDSVLFSQKSYMKLPPMIKILLGGYKLPR